MKKFQEITDFLDKHNIEYTIHLDCVEVENNLLLTNKNLTSLPKSFANLKIVGDLKLDDNYFTKRVTSLPESLYKLPLDGGYWERISGQRKNK